MSDSNSEPNTPDASSIQIRALSTANELDQVVALQRQEWDDPSTVIYTHMLTSFVRNGGTLIGAVVGDKVVGFVLGYLGVDSPDSTRPAMANLKLVSQRMTVAPDYRNAGLGYRLKIAQRAAAAKMGLRLVTWTFDPMNSRNAHLNIRKLGCVVQDYEVDYYGVEPSPLVSLGQSDRLVAEWRISQPRVEQRISGGRPPLTYAQYMDGNATIINPSHVRADGLPTPGTLQPVRSMIGLLEIPSRFNDLMAADEALARAWRAHGRNVFMTAFRSGYFITDFIHHKTAEREQSFYVLSADSGNNGFSAN
jgi:predicted GNAT superfamily acetyltransferase